MEVKINNNGEMLDATIEMVDGVMVVSPKKVKFEPKDGDVLSRYFKGKCRGIFVFKEAGKCKEAIFHVALDVNGKFIKGDGRYFLGYVDDVRPATEEEKQKLFDKLKEEGCEFDFEKKELVGLKWKPNYASLYYKPAIRKAKIVVSEDSWFENDLDKCYYDKGWAFKTYEECNAFCNKLKQAIEGVKP